MNRIKANEPSFELLIAALDMVELEERLEMVSLASLEQGPPRPVINGCCCDAP